MLDEEQETLGSYLRRERKKRDVSVEQIAYATRISLKMLTALEEDQHTSLPAQPFVRGYLKAYAKYVNLDPKDVLLRYQHHLATQPSEAPWNSQSRLDAEENSVNEKRRLIFAVSGLVIILAAGGTFYWLRNKLAEENARVMSRAPVLKNAASDVTIPSTTTLPSQIPVGPTQPMSTEANPLSSAKPSPPISTEPIKAPPVKAEVKPAEPTPAKPETTVAATPSPVTAPTPIPTPAVVASPAPLVADATPKKYNLSLKAKEDVWLRFQTDSDETKDLILRMDKVITIRADKVIRMFSGNVKAMTGNLNGQPLESLTQGDWKRSVVIPFSEIPNTSLPLFPGGPGEGSSESARSSTPKTNSGSASSASQ